MKTKNNYLDPNEFHDEIKRFQETGKASEKIGQILLDLTSHLLGSSSFSRYEKELKEDMRGYALQRCMLALKKYDTTRDPKSSFSYFTRVCWNSYLTVIMKHYRQENIKRDLMKRMLMNPEYHCDEATRRRRLNDIFDFEDSMKMKKSK